MADDKSRAGQQTSAADAKSHEGRPEFLNILGLVPPCTVEDVRQAYLSKVKTAHPDVGGDENEFRKLQEAYERATEWAKFRASRIAWLSTWVEKYVEQDALVAEIAHRGGKVHTEGVDWLRRSFGDDFSVVAEKIIGLDFTGPAVTDDTLDWLGTHRSALVALKALNLSSAAVSDEGLQHVAAFPNLQKLDISDTKVSSTGLYVLQRLPSLERLGMRNIPLGWFARLRLKWRYPKLQLEA